MFQEIETAGYLDSSGLCCDRNTGVKDEVGFGKVIYNAKQNVLNVSESMIELTR